MVPKKLNVMVARYPYAGNGGYASEIPDVGDWLVEIVLEMKQDPRIGEVIPWRKADTPIPAVRNESVMVAKRNGCDLLLMIDSDNVPDYEFKRGTPGSKPFWKTAFDFIYDHYDKGPAVIGAPYCGPPPHENVYVFQVSNRESEHAQIDFQVDQFSRHQAAERTGIERVAALPTGLILFDLRVFDYLPPPWFYYEWTDKYQWKKASTEDVTATRDMWFHAHRAGKPFPIYVAWDCWAGHVKPKIVGKPQIITCDQVSDKYIEAVKHGYDSREGVKVVNGMEKALALGAKPYVAPEAKQVTAATESRAENLRDKFAPIPQVEAYIESLATGMVVDFGGNYTHKFSRASRTCGWDGDDKCDFSSDSLPYQDKQIDFAYSRHTVEDLTDPTRFLQQLNRVAKSGYIETPSPLVELTRNITNQHRGFVHHHWYAWSEDGVLNFLPKVSIVEPSSFRQFAEELAADKFRWNTYHTWSGELKFKVWRHELDYNITERPREYEAILHRAVKASLRGAEEMRVRSASSSVVAAPAQAEEDWQTPLWMLEQHGYTPALDLEVIRRLVKEQSVKLGREPVVVELGTLIGQSTKAMACAGAVVFSIDNREGSPHDGTFAVYAVNRDSVVDALNENLGKLHGKKVHLIVGDSEAVAARWSKAIDILYVDADHEYGPTKANILAWMDYVRPGGIIAGHDYCDLFPGVVQSIDELFPDCNVEGNVWWLEKPAAKEPVNRLAPYSYPEFEEDVPETIANGHAG